MQTKPFYIKCDDDHQMPVHRWLTNDEPTALVLISHGMAEYARRYATIATELNKHGIAVFIYDQRGHGDAVANLEELGIASPNWFNKQVDDIDLLVAHLRAIYPGKKIFLLGHSMGSFLAQRYFQLYGKNIDGLILSATNGKADPLLGAGIALAWLQVKLLGSKHRSYIIDKLSFGRFNAAFKPNRTNHDWLSRDETEVDKYVQDPNCGFVCSAGFFYYFFKGIREVLDQHNLKQAPTHIPVYVFAGDRDPVGLAGKGFLALIKKWKAAGIKDISYELYQDGRHEMLNEINRAEVVGNLVKWIKDHL